MPPRNDRRHRDQRKIPLFARSHPYLYKVFLISAQFTTPLALLTLLVKAGVFQRGIPIALSSSSASASTSTPSWRLPFSPLGTTAPISFSPLLKSSWKIPLDWRKCSVWLWYMSLWSYLARHALIGSSVMWVLNGWEDEPVGQEEQRETLGEMIERERANDVAETVGGADAGTANAGVEATEGGTTGDGEDVQDGG